MMVIVMVMVIMMVMVMDDNDGDDGGGGDHTYPLPWMTPVAQEAVVSSGVKIIVRSSHSVASPVSPWMLLPLH